MKNNIVISLSLFLSRHIITKNIGFINYLCQTVDGLRTKVRSGFYRGYDKSVSVHKRINHAFK